MNLVIDNYSFTTTSVPTSPSMQVVSGSSTYYVNVTDAPRPEHLSDQKIFVYTDSSYSFLRPFVTEYITTGFLGYTSSEVDLQHTGSTMYYTSQTDIVPPNASSLNSVSLSGITNWSLTGSSTTNTGTTIHPTEVPYYLYVTSTLSWR